jgi:hypothetical protein
LAGVAFITIVSDRRFVEFAAGGVIVASHVPKGIGGRLDRHRLSMA